VICSTAFNQLSSFLHSTCHIVINSSTDIRALNENAPKSELFVTALRFVSDQVFEEVNKFCLLHRWPCLKGVETPEYFEIGPFVRPFDSACLTCPQLRRRGVIEFPIEEKLFQDYVQQTSTHAEVGLSGENTAFSLIPVGMLAMECIRITTTITFPTLQNSSFLFRSLDGRITNNRILRVPHCPDCQRS
jgi:bacteriocin biosynthesis cyclodehydratase domain-containing protein